MQTHAGRATIHHADTVVGILTMEDNPAMEDNGGKVAVRSYRFTALDPRFHLLDGSRFFGPQKAAVAVNRIGRFVDRPVPANEP
jgi:hypothetical protein